MKVEVTILNSRFNEKDDDDEDEHLDTYNKLFWEHIKLKKAKKKALESHEEKEKDLSMLKSTLE